MLGDRFKSPRFYKACCRCLIYCVILLLSQQSGFYGRVFRAEEALPQTRHSQAIKRIVKILEKKYNLKIYYAEIPELTWKKEISADLAEEGDYPALLSFLVVLDTQLQKYPAELFKKNVLSGAVLSKKLFYKSRPVEGLYDYPKKVIFFDFSRDSGDKRGQAHNIHHEMYHMIDVAFFKKSGWREDGEWLGFNPSGFKYKESSQSIYSERNAKNVFKPKVNGFVSTYSQTSVKEDQAEIFACMMVESQRNVLREWSKDDDILRKKIDWVRKYLDAFLEEFEIVDEFEL